MKQVCSRIRLYLQYISFRKKINYYCLCYFSSPFFVLLSTNLQWFLFVIIMKILNGRRQCRININAYSRILYYFILFIFFCCCCCCPGLNLVLAYAKHKFLLALFRGWLLGFEPKGFTLGYIPSFCFVLFICLFDWLKWSLDKLARLSLNLWSSFLSFLECWDYRHPVPIQLSALSVTFTFQHGQTSLMGTEMLLAGLLYFPGSVS